jgi:hypothetical protein
MCAPMTGELLLDDGASEDRLSKVNYSAAQPLAGPPRSLCRQMAAGRRLDTSALRTLVSAAVTPFQSREAENACAQGRGSGRQCVQAGVCVWRAMWAWRGVAAHNAKAVSPQQRVCVRRRRRALICHHLQYIDHSLHPRWSHAPTRSLHTGLSPAGPLNRANPPSYL